MNVKLVHAGRSNSLNIDYGCDAEAAEGKGGDETVEAQGQLEI